MNKYIIYAVSLAALVSLASCGHKQHQGQQRGGVQTAPVIKLQTKTVKTFTSYPTNIEGVINVSVRAKISGYITKVLVDEGQKVHKGQLLFKLETHSLSEEADAANANIHAAQVEVNQLKPLVKKNIISPSKLATAKARLKQAKSQYQSIVANIGYSDIRSPVDGYVGEIRLRRGNLVSPSDPTPMTTVSDVSKVYAYFSMNEKDYLNFIAKAKGKSRQQKINNLPKVSLIMANGQEYPQKGKIQTINSQVNKETGSISFRAIFDNPNRLLTNGSTGEIKIPKTYTDIVAVPQQSTFEQQDKTLVMKVVGSGDSTSVKPVVIDIAKKVRNLYLVKSGVTVDDEIVAKNPATLHADDLIKPKLIPYDSVAKHLPVIFFK